MEAEVGEPLGQRQGLRIAVRRMLEENARCTAMRSLGRPLNLVDKTATSSEEVVCTRVASGGRNVRHRRDIQSEMESYNERQLNIVCTVPVTLCQITANPKQRFLDFGSRLLFADQRHSQRRNAAPPGVKAKGRNTHLRMGTCV
ncbi:hypothetical protein SVAN01_06951 [Stagonosporopsis vannaccii]|nr:hypothetical protein SVAN01_06951 [Stagonosporopsis vannaccii]